MRVVDLNSEQGNVFFIFSLLKQEMLNLGYTKETVSIQINKYQKMSYDEIIEDIEDSFGNEIKFVKL